MSIEPIEARRYYVQLGTGGRYLVDLDEFRGNGFCGCRDFEVRHLPGLEKGVDDNTPLVISRCKHLRIMFHNEASKSLAGEPTLEKGENEPPTKATASQEATGVQHDPKETCLWHNDYMATIYRAIVDPEERKRRICNSCPATDTCGIKTLQAHP